MGCETIQWSCNTECTGAYTDRATMIMVQRTSRHNSPNTLHGELFKVVTLLHIGSYSQYKIKNTGRHSRPLPILPLSQPINQPVHSYTSTTLPKLGYRKKAWSQRRRRNVMFLLILFSFSSLPLSSMATPPPLQGNSQFLLA